ncbi:YhbY family RNA-binding protein [Caballeronia sp. LP006]|jgi:putative YhbY family RNA-binding protein|uniref:YhbY family RNA-binding protein n=1 Tax=unclassified Caballeronia TaxID=2646786 RepID=UPI001FD63099|nr:MULTISPECIES: YhbY family RNA-binding protein [unclassified Caballeronia]MDR5772128.1 YhbY family RNA-binding protein [Caballeronia sp. LZ002]MDR5804439.1 YhbY family RNA-binding protein [Caballeronia sp. LZ001]MDR5831724.1 YhbY family RNA-binding protein [Caballeronia sp. LP006]MDR5847562.1 YhbY family RNA-binding protein [Caballeronia sp. LZ003]
MPALKLSPAQRADLRSQAHALNPVVLVGAEGLTEAVLKEIGVHLEAHQLIKIRVFGDEREARVGIYDEICDRLDAAPVQHIGKLLVIWRPEGAAPAKTRTARTRSTMPPSAGEIAEERSTKGRAPRIVKAVKITRDAPAVKKPRKQTLKVLGNERVTAGGNVKRAKKRQAGSKRQHQAVK